jgi:hypothetical protein
LHSVDLRFPHLEITHVMAAWSPTEAAEFAAAKRIALARALGSGDILSGMELLLIRHSRTQSGAAGPPALTTQLRTPECRKTCLSHQHAVPGAAPPGATASSRRTSDIVTFDDVASSAGSSSTAFSGSGS